MTKMSPWEKGLAALNEWVAAGGTASPVRTDVTESGRPVGQWVDARRREYRAGTLAPERIEALEAFTGWVWGPHQAAWQEKYAALVQWAARGNITLNQRADDLAERELAVWVKNQRLAYRAGKLDEDRIKQLEDLDLWVWEPGQASWHAAFANLQRYVELHGGALVPESFEATGEYPHPGHKLGIWVTNQRQRHRRGVLKDWRVELLGDTAGWVWKVSA